MWTWVAGRIAQWTQRTRGAWASARSGSDVPMPSVAPVRLRSSISGRYASLHAHLENRYADNVVLSFGQIEDVLGFSLPAGARTRSEWWTAPVASAAEPPYADAWRSAGRTATPNLFAQNVAFERVLVR